MPWRPESHAEKGWWSSVMTELDVIDAHTKAAVTFHTLMDQHTPLGTPVQYERLLLRARGGHAGPMAPATQPAPRPPPAATRGVPPSLAPVVTSTGSRPAQTRRRSVTLEREDSQGVHGAICLGWSWCMGWEWCAASSVRRETTGERDEDRSNLCRVEYRRRV